MSVYQNITSVPLVGWPMYNRLESIFEKLKVTDKISDNIKLCYKSYQEGTYIFTNCLCIEYTNNNITLSIYKGLFNSFLIDIYYSGIVYNKINPAINKLIYLIITEVSLKMKLSDE